MRYSSIGYLISEGFRSIVKQKKMTSASIIIMCATMFIFGAFFLIGENVNYIMKQVESQQGMRVVIKDDATEDEINNLKTRIQQITGVNKVTFQSKEDALASMKTVLGTHQDLLDTYAEDNPFPASYFVTFTGKVPVAPNVPKATSTPAIIFGPYASLDVVVPPTIASVGSTADPISPYTAKIASAYGYN